MSVQKPWDKYEAVILLDALLQIKNGASKKDVIKRVSTELRQKAVNQGFDIDEIFRNENGISMQMSIMTSLMEGKKSGLHGASRVFIDIVKLYKENPQSFNEIVKEINTGKMADITIKEQDNEIIANPKNLLNKDDLSKQVTSGNMRLNKKEGQIDFSDVDFNHYKKILSDYYKKGFRFNDKLSLKRFRMQWQKTFGDELQYDDEIICKHIAHITLNHGDMAYLPEFFLSESTKQKLLMYIHELFENGKYVIYYEALYKEFSEDFSYGRINNVDMLKTYLEYINDGSMYLKKYYIAFDNSIEVDNADEIRNLLISYGMPMQTDDIISSLSHISEDKIKWTLSGHNSQEFVRNQVGEYFHANIIEFTPREMDFIIDWISLAIADKEYMGGKELTDVIESKLPSVKERYPFLTWLGLRDVLAYKLRDSFSFKGKIISAYGQELSMTDVFSDFAKRHNSFTLSQLKMLKNDLDTPIYFDSIYSNSLRINKEEFVSSDYASFDVIATDSAIDSFCQGDFISIKEVTLFGSFPDAHFPWNQFLLQHYVANYSKKYKLLHTGFNAGTPVGAITKRSSEIESFDEVVIRALANSNISLNSDNALQFLYDEGYLARRNLGNIDTLIVKANLYRAKKGE